MSSIGGRLEKLIDDLGMLKKDFAAKLEVSPNTVGSWIHRGATMQKDKTAKIKALFNVNLDWLLNGNGSMFIDRECVDTNIDDIREWLNGLSADDKAWIKKEMGNRFPEYQKWKENR